MLQNISDESGLDRAEVIRRSVRLFGREAKKQGRLPELLMELTEKKFLDDLAKFSGKVIYHPSAEGLKAAEDPPFVDPKKARRRRAGG